MARGADTSELTFAELVCLTLVDQGVDHGWAIGRMLAADGELGRVWTLSRPLTYRAIEQLATKGLIERDAPSAAAARERTLLSITVDGKVAVKQWLDAPVEHLRDVRTELVLKLVLRERAGLDTTALLAAQQSAFAEHFDHLTTAGAGADVVELWRRESARAVRRFLDAALARPVAAATGEGAPPLRMRLSARNQVVARIVSITHGDVLTTVKTALADGQTITAVITKESVNDLDLAPDDEVLVVVKSTEVMLAKP